MDNLEKLALLGTQDEEKQNKNTTQYVGHHYVQTNTNNVNKTRTLIQRTGGTPGLIFLFGFLLKQR
jgi:hypothetical protein